MNVFQQFIQLRTRSPKRFDSVTQNAFGGPVDAFAQFVDGFVGLVFEFLRSVDQIEPGQLGGVIELLIDIGGIRIAIGFVQLP